MITTKMNVCFKVLNKETVIAIPRIGKSNPT